MKSAVNIEAFLGGTISIGFPAVSIKVPYSMLPTVSPISVANPGVNFRTLISVKSNSIVMTVDASAVALSLTVPSVRV